MDELIKKRPVQERLIIAKTLLESVLSDLPSIEPSIIRCKDCKHWYNAPVSDGFNSCEHDALIRHEDFYCANAERRTDE